MINVFTTTICLFLIASVTSIYLFPLLLLLRPVVLIISQVNVWANNFGVPCSFLCMRRKAEVGLVSHYMG